MIVQKFIAAGVPGYTLATNAKEIQYLAALAALAMQGTDERLGLPAGTGQRVHEALQTALAGQ